MYLKLLQELKDRTVHNYTVIVLVAFVSCFFIYGVVSGKKKKILVYYTSFIHPSYTLHTPSLPHMHLCTPIIHVYTPYTHLTHL